jgi:hypothetical protein
MIPNSKVALVSRIDPNVFPSRFLTELRSARNDMRLTVIPSDSEESQFNFGIRDDSRFLPRQSGVEMTKGDDSNVALLKWNWN